MSAGTAVLASFDRGTDMQYIIEKNRLGVFTEAENIQEFVKAVHILYSNPEECVQMGKRGRCYILEHLTREVGTRKYIGVIESICLLYTLDVYKRQVMNRWASTTTTAFR